MKVVVILFVRRLHRVQPLRLFVARVLSGINSESVEFRLGLKTQKSNTKVTSPWNVHIFCRSHYVSEDTWHKNHRHELRELRAARNLNNNRIKNTTVIKIQRHVKAVNETWSKKGVGMEKKWELSFQMHKEEVKEKGRERERRTEKQRVRERGSSFLSRKACHVDITDYLYLLKTISTRLR